MRNQTYHQRQPTTDTINNDCHVDQASGKLDDSINTSRHKRHGALLNTEHGEDLGSKVVDGIGTGELVEDEQEAG